MSEPDVSTEEYRAQAVAWFLSSEKTIAEIAHTLNLSESTVRQWVWTATPEEPSDDPRPDPDAAVRAEPETAQPEAALSNAAAVEAVRRAETMATEAVARAEAVANEAKGAAAEARAAADDLRAQLDAVRAELQAARVEIAARGAAEAAAREEAAAAVAGTVEPVAADAEPDRAEPEADVEPRDLERAGPEAEARAKIAEVMARAKSVELWVHATGRTLEAATAEVLGRLGVDEEQAEIEVLATGSRWLPGRVQVRGRVRGRTELRLITKPAGPGPVASAGPGPADGRG